MHSGYEICSIIFVAATGYHRQNKKKSKKLAKVLFRRIRIRIIRRLVFPRPGADYVAPRKNMGISLNRPWHRAAACLACLGCTPTT
jgi:hypothetical protein